MADLNVSLTEGVAGNEHTNVQTNESTYENDNEDLVKHDDASDSEHSLLENSSSASFSAARLLKDLKEIAEDEDMMIQANASENSIYNWNVTFPAPNGKIIKAELHFDNQYPTIPPKMFVKQRLFHPNVNAINGSVCFDSLESTWTAAHSVWSLILSVKCLLSDPNPQDPVNMVAANMLMEHPEQYHEMAEKYFEMLDWIDDKDIGEDSGHLAENVFENYTVDEQEEDMLVQSILHMQLFPG